MMAITPPCQRETIEKLYTHITQTSDPYTTYAMLSHDITAAYKMRSYAS